MEEKSTSSSESNPLIYAYIGTQDPMRGDSKARVGIAKTTAQILGGEYVYVDEATLQEHFPTIKGFNERLQQFIKEKGMPDILVGHDTSGLFLQEQKKPLVLFEYVPESIASITSEKGYTPSQLKGIVAHDLTPEVLETEGQIFREKYKDLKGPLVAVMMGGGFSKYDVTKAAKAMRKVIKNYEEVSVFVCPSRRTNEKFDQFMDVVENNVHAPLHLDMLMTSLKKVFDIENRGSEISWSNHMQLHGVNYEECVSDYNPYIGLLENADHIVVLGQSQSLISEALFTGKTVMHAAGPHCELHSELYDMGVIKDLKDIVRKGEFDTQEIKPISTVYESAEKLAAEYIDELKRSVININSL